VDVDAAAAPGEPVDPAEQLGAGLLTECLDRRVRGEHELAAQQGLRPRPAARIGLAEAHLHAFDSAETSLAEKTHRHCQPAELDAFVTRLLDLVRVRRHLCGSAPIYERHLARPEAQRLTRDV